MGLFDPKDQRRVWVPFHFLPGNQGSTYSQQLKCTKNSLIAQEMLTNHFTHISSDFGLHLIGIATHVYADTFSHYGFSGVSSRGNRVHQSSFEFSSNLDSNTRQYILGKAARFFSKKNLFPNLRDKFLKLVSASKAAIAENAGALGHGSVATYPDRPYLSWRFNYEDKNNTDSQWRHNQETFLEGCKELHSFFCLIAKQHPNLANSKPCKFSDIEIQVKKVLAVEAPCEGRIKAWQEAASSGSFGTNLAIPDYFSDQWMSEWSNLQQDGAISTDAHATNIYQFYRAAAYHRVFILRDHLPNHGLIVD